MDDNKAIEEQPVEDQQIEETNNEKKIILETICSINEQVEDTTDVPKFKLGNSIIEIEEKSITIGVSQVNNISSIENEKLQQQEFMEVDETSDVLKDISNLNEGKKQVIISYQII